VVCAATGRWAEAITLWAALDAEQDRAGTAPTHEDNRGLRRQAIQALPVEEHRAAAERGAWMTLAAAVEYVILLTEDQETTEPREAEGHLEGDDQADAKGLTERERELVRLVARGLTNPEISAELHISVRTVNSHLDRIRLKTGYRRRADLTRLALNEGLV